MVKHLNLYQKHNKMSHLSDQGQDVWHRRHYVPLPFHHHGCCQNNTQREGGHCGQGNTLHLPPPHQRPHWRWSRSKTLDRGHRAYCAVIDAPFWRDVKWSACSGAALYCYWCISCFATCTRHMNMCCSSLLKQKQMFQMTSSGALCLYQLLKKQIELGQIPPVENGSTHTDLGSSHIASSVSVFHA